MPFKSQAQRRKFAELMVQGKISPQTFEEWNRETGSAKLPERAPRKQAKKKSAPKKAARKKAASKTRKKVATSSRKKTTARKRSTPKQR